MDGGFDEMGADDAFGTTRKRDEASGRSEQSAAQGRKTDGGRPGVQRNDGWADAILLRTTLPGEAQARAVARALIERRLAACCHVTRTDSVYIWSGKIVEGAEWLLEARIVGEAGPAVEAVRVAHPDEVPLLELVSSRVSAPYARWAKSAVGLSD